jgi:hypothetical protein
VKKGHLSFIPKVENKNQKIRKKCDLGRSLKIIYLYRSLEDAERQK